MGTIVEEVMLELLQRLSKISPNREEGSDNESLQREFDVEIGRW